MIFNEKAETMASCDRQKIQLERWQALVKNVYENVPFYREKFDKHNVHPSDLKTLEDVAKFPFTTKYELRETYPFKLLAVDKKDIVEVHTSSGTTGTPVVGAYTKEDLEMWSEAVARCLCMTGATSQSVLQNGYGYGLFTGGIGIHYGTRKLGANVIPISAGNTERQLKMINDFGTSILTCTPSYALFLCEKAKEIGLDFSKTELKTGIFGAEPWSNSMRKEIENSMSIKAYDIYGLTEIVGPGVSCECEEQNGLHINEDFFYPEIINPETGEVLPDGEKGELVFSTINKFGAPIIRYRTRDITYIYNEKCSCGRTLRKMHRLMGRTDDMLIIKGVNVFPSQIEEILIEIEETQPHYQIIVDRGNTHLDSLEIQVEVEQNFFSDETKKMEAIKKKINNTMKNRLGINAKITLVEPKSIERSTGKAKRVIDKRKI